MDPVPRLSAPQALAAAAAVPLLFVLPFHAAPLHLRRCRDSPAAVGYRTVSTLLSAALTVAAMHAAPAARCGLPLAAWLGLTLPPMPPNASSSTDLAAAALPALHPDASARGSSSLAAAAAAAAALLLLYTPVLIALLLGIRPPSHRHQPRHLLARSLVIAPVVEELVFRACVGRLLLSGGASATAVVVASPLVFALAHVNHAVEAVVLHGAPVATALGRAAAQAVYTSLFGSVACLALHKTGSLAAPVALHAACNWLGAPLVAAAGCSAVRWRLLRAAALLGATASAWQLTRLAAMPDALPMCAS